MPVRFRADTSGYLARPPLNPDESVLREYLSIGDEFHRAASFNERELRLNALFGRYPQYVPEELRKDRRWVSLNSFLQDCRPIPSGAVIVQCQSPNEPPFARSGGVFPIAQFSSEQALTVEEALLERKPMLWFASFCDLDSRGNSWSWRSSPASYDAYLFGPSFWRLKGSETCLDAEQLRLLFLEAVDRDRLKFERLKRKFTGLAGQPKEDRRERISEEVRIFVWRRDEGKCVKCGSQEHLEFDHIIPFAKGGGSTERNIQLLCESCNRKKSDQI